MRLNSFYIPLKEMEIRVIEQELIMVLIEFIDIFVKIKNRRKLKKSSLNYVAQGKLEYLEVEIMECQISTAGQQIQRSILS